MNEFEMNEQELFERTHQVLAEHEKAKAAYKAAKTDDERKQVLEKYPDYKHGYLPLIPARKVFEAMKVHCGDAGLELADPNFVEKCERVILQSPESAEICYHVANKIRKGPWPEAEDVIAESPCWAYLYAKLILRGPFSAGEEAIRSNPVYSERYDRFLESERTRQSLLKELTDAKITDTDFRESTSPQNTRHRGAISRSYRPSKKSIPEDAGGTGQDHNYDEQRVWNYGDSHNDAGNDC